MASTATAHAVPKENFLLRTGADLVELCAVGARRKELGLCENQYILEAILGYSQERITELVVGGVL